MTHRGDEPGRSAGLGRAPIAKGTPLETPTDPTDCLACRCNGAAVATELLRSGMLLVGRSSVEQRGIRRSSGRQGEHHSRALLIE